MNSFVEQKQVTKPGPPLPKANWIDDKLLLCVNPLSSSSIHTNYDQQTAVPLNTPFKFESSIFKGQAIMRVIDLTNTNKAYFDGRARKVDFTIQGEFKRKIGFDKLYSGQIFDKPFTKLPAQYMIAAITKIITMLAPAIKADINSNTPYMMSPLVSAAQRVHICVPGKQIPLPNEAKEDVSMLDKKFKDMKWTNRKAYFHDLNHLKEYYFEPGLIYTISCYTHMLHLVSYCVHILGMKIGICRYLPSPIQAAVVVLPDDEKKNDDEVMESEDFTKCEFLVNLQVWHRDLVDEMFPDLTPKKHKKKTSIFW